MMNEGVICSVLNTICHGDCARVFPWIGFVKEHLFPIKFDRFIPDGRLTSLKNWYNILQSLFLTTDKNHCGIYNVQRKKLRSWRCWLKLAPQLPSVSIHLERHTVWLPFGNLYALINPCFVCDSKWYENFIRLRLNSAKQSLKVAHDCVCGDWGVDPAATLQIAFSCLCYYAKSKLISYVVGSLKTISYMCSLVSDIITSI